MYELEYPTPIAYAPEDSSPVPMVIALQGYADAGNAVVGTGSHLLAALDHSLVAQFNTDELIDYRSRRPGVVIENSRVVTSDKLQLHLHLVRDTRGEPLYVLTGPEPDLKWEAFGDAVVTLARRLNIDRVVSIYSAPMAVPHTRPLSVFGHASSAELLGDFPTWDAKLIVPGSATLETELKLSRAGVDTIGFTAHVPHYVAQNEYPEATLRLLAAVEKITNRTIPVGSIEQDAHRVAEQLEQQTEENPEISHVVASLEQLYDAEVERRAAREQSRLLQPGSEVPTAEELGAEIEAFLADVRNDSDFPDSPSDGTEDFDR